MRLDGLVAEAGLRELGLLITISGDPSTDVRSISMDSRRVDSAAMFACVPGRVTDGHLFAASAVSAGAKALLCEHVLALDVPQVVVTSVRRSLGPLCDAVLGHPSQHLTVAAVTGTNGKTTTCAFLAGIFDANGWPALTIGTLSQPRTTPEAPQLQALMAEWRGRGGRAVAMEVSSHALDQHRVDATRFAAGIFTNLTPEHLDYHQTMDSYFDAKARLFDAGRVPVAVINRSDPWGQRLIDRLHSQQSATDIAPFDSADAQDLRLLPGQSTFRWAGHDVKIRVGGRFNVLNALAAANCARSLGIAPATVASGLSTVSGVEGRFQIVDAGQPFTVIVDYAHTPDGLVKVLDAARELCAGRVIVVFGAGGDRDQDKRPLMGAAATQRADVVVVTSDNPRSEDPDRIVAEIVAGTSGSSNVTVEVDRASAIAGALAQAEPGDVVVIAGKGHERGQEIGGRILPFDDVEVAWASLHWAGAGQPEDG